MVDVTEAAPAATTPTKRQRPAEPPLLDSWRRWYRAERRRDSGGSAVARIGQLYRRREVLVGLVVGSLKANYGTSLIGLASIFIQPISLILIYWVVFGQVARLGLTHYPLFIAAGMMPWLFFNNAVGGSLGSLRSNSGIIRTISMPREIFPLANVGRAFVEYVVSLPLVFALGFIYGVPPSRYIFLLPVAVAIEFVLVIGLSFWLSSMAAIIRDTQRLWRPTHRIWFYLSPILYPVKKIHVGILVTLYKFNPIVGIIELNRLVWYPHYTIAPSTVFMHAEISAGVSLLFLVCGWALFMRVEPEALKEL